MTCPFLSLACLYAEGLDTGCVGLTFAERTKDARLKASSEAVSYLVAREQ